MVFSSIADSHGQPIFTILTSTSQSLNILKILSHTSWGSDSRTLIKIHKVIIQSKIYYGSNVHKTASRSSLNAIDSTNNTELKLTIGAFRSSPIYSIYNIAGEPTPEIKRNNLSFKYLVRSYISNPLPSENTDLYDELENNGIIVDQSMTREQLPSPP